MLDFINVESSSIEAIKYEKGLNTLVVLFKSGQLYRYNDISPTEFNDLLNADSVGSHFAKHIRNNKQFVKFEEQLAA